MSAELTDPSQQNLERTELVGPKKKKSPLEILKQFKGRQGFFIKSFFADEEFNSNNWRITDEAKNRDIFTGLETEYFGKTAPVILREDFGHPPDDSPDIVAAQEPDRVGNFLDVGVDAQSGNAFFVAHITEANAIKAIQDGKVNYISPSFRSIDEFHTANGIVITRFKVNHVALVKEPAYGKLKAQIRGRCAGEPETCLRQLKDVHASMTLQAINLNDVIFGDTKKERQIQFNTQEDSKVDDKICRPLMGKKFDVTEEAFPFIPDDTHPNCRCFYKQVSSGRIIHEISSTFNAVKLTDDFGEIPINEKFATIKDGKVRIAWGSKQHLLFHAQNFPHEHLAIKANGEEIIHSWSGIEKGKNNEAESGSMDANFDSSGISISQCQKTGNFVIEVSAQTNECVSKWISELSDSHPEWSRDQIIAVAFEKCRSGAKTESLKTKASKKKSLTAQEDEDKKKRDEELEAAAKARIAQEEEEKKKKDNENRESQNDMDERMKKNEDEIKALKHVIDEEVKEPMAAKIIEARVRLGQLKEEKIKEEKQSLLVKAVSELRTLAADYEAMEAKIKDAKAESTMDIKYNLQASDEETGEKELLANIRGRMS